MFWCYITFRMMDSNSISRRDFLGKAGVATVCLTIVPSIVLGRKVGKTAPSDKLNIAGIGIGGRGYEVLRNMASENIVALCDVDWKYGDKCFKAFPKASRYRDWRRMLDEMGKTIDAVMIATPNHTHAIIAAHSMIAGKHVYVEQPLAHTIYESRLLTKLAEKYKVATQMGNQGSSQEGVRKICEWIWNDEIGDVRKVEAFTDRTALPQKLNNSKKGMMVPDSLSWDMFIGPASLRPYHEMYTPYNWREWWDFGIGVLGDMACHIMHPAFKALNLAYVSKAQGSSTSLFNDCVPNAQIISMKFAERPAVAKAGFPEAEIVWYNGGIQPMKPEGWPAGKNMNDSGGGVLFHGSKETLVRGCYGKDPWLLSGRLPIVTNTLPRVLGEQHELDWIRACKENYQNRVETSSPFSDAGPLNEIILVGALATRLQALNTELLWDRGNMRFSNISNDQYVKELIKPTYRQGWTLPEMPA